MRGGLEGRLCAISFGNAATIRGHIMPYIACGDGWEPIVYRLGERITKIVETILESHQDSGDTEIPMERGDQKKAESGSRSRLTRPDFRFMYIKEKIRNTTPEFKPTDLGT